MHMGKIARKATAWEPKVRPAKIQQKCTLTRNFKIQEIDTLSQGILTFTWHRSAGTVPDKKTCILLVSQEWPSYIFSRLNHWQHSWQE